MHGVCVYVCAHVCVHAFEYLEHISARCFRSLEGVGYNHAQMSSGDAIVVQNRLVWSQGYTCHSRRWDLAMVLRGGGSLTYCPTLPFNC